MIEVAPKTITVFADIGCPWAHLAVYRLHSTRARLGLENEVHFDMRAFPLELLNEQATPKQILDAEVPVVGALDPAAGWQMWQRPVTEWPVTTLPALEAVEAAKEQSPAASESLDRALRVALFGHSRNISMHHEIVDIAEQLAELDVDLLEEALKEGRGRRSIFEDKAVSQREEVEGSPHLFFPDGTNLHNPGITKHWENEPGKGFPVVDEDRAQIYEDLLQRAAG